MPRRFRAALAALAIPVMAIPALTIASAGPTQGATGVPSAPGDDSAAHVQLRKSWLAPLQREQNVSRSARRARTASEAPLAVTIDDLTPSVIPKAGQVRVSGVITNTDTVTWSTINVRPFISTAPLTNPAQLAEAAAQPEDAVVGERINDEDHKYFIESLEPGESANYTVTVPRELLGVSTPGVYWFGVHALGEGPEGRDDTADGRARTFLPLVPDARPGTQPTAIVIPLRHRISHAADGTVEDPATWTRVLSTGGRLRSLVEFGATAGSRTMTWVIDPALIDAVRRLAAGNPPRSLAATVEPDPDPDAEPGEDEGTGTETEPAGEPAAEPTGEEPDGPATEPVEPPGTEPGEEPTQQPEPPDPVTQAAAEAAQEWLDRLSTAIGPDDQVMTLPYGDIDVAAAQRHDPSLYELAVTRAGTALPGLDVVTSPVISSPSGYVSTEGIVASTPETTILLTDAMVTDPDPAVGITGGRRVVVTSSGAAAGGPGPNARTSLIAMRQRLLSEAAVRFLRGDQAPLTMVLPHAWVPPEGSAPFFSGLDHDWLNLTSVSGVIGASTLTPMDGTQLTYPNRQREAELAAANFQAAAELIRSGVTLQELLTLNNVVSGTITDQALSTVSYSARSRPLANLGGADRSRVWVEDRLKQIQVSAPRAVTLSSSSGRFRATVTNGLDEPVTVFLNANADDTTTIEGLTRIDLDPGGRAALLLTVNTDANGIHEVTLGLTDQRGTPLGTTTNLTVRSAQVSNLIWLILGAGATLLFGAIAVRLFRRVRAARRASRRGGASEDGQAGDHRHASGATTGAGTR